MPTLKNVQTNSQSFMAQGFYFLGGLLHAFEIDVAARDVGAHLRQSQRNGPPDALRRTGYQRDSSLKVHGISSRL